MSKEHNLVDCKRCDHWTVEHRRTNICHGCNNSRKVIDPKEILCNLCGGCMCPIGTMNEQYPHGLVNAKATGGYDSFHLSDMTTYTFSFCEECLRKLFIQCKIKPTIYDTDFDGNLREEEVWAQDQKYYEYRVWEAKGGKHQAYLDGKCNLAKECSNKAIYTKLISDEFSEDCCCEEHKDRYRYGNSKLVQFIPNVLKPFL